MADWLSAHGGLKVEEIKTVALPYLFGRDGDLYHFAYSYIYPKAK